MTFMTAAACLAAAATAANRAPVRTHFYEIPHVMSCLVYLPAGYDPDQRYPLLIALHGRGGSAGSFDSLWRSHLDVRYLFAVPEAPYPVPIDKKGGSSGRSWYLLVKEKRIWELADPLAVRAVMATVAELRTCYKAGPVYILGFSQGASLAYQAGLSHPDDFAGVIAIAGFLPNEVLSSQNLEKARSSLRVFIAHGSRDPLIPYKRSEEARSRLEAAGLQVTFRKFRGGHAISDELFHSILEWIGAVKEQRARTN